MRLTVPRFVVRLGWKIKAKWWAVSLYRAGHHRAAHIAWHWRVTPGTTCDAFRASQENVLRRFPGRG